MVSFLVHYSFGVYLSPLNNVVHNARVGVTEGLLSPHSFRHIHGQQSHLIWSHLVSTQYILKWVWMFWLELLVFSYFWRICWEVGWFDKVNGMALGGRWEENLGIWQLWLFSNLQKPYLSLRIFWRGITTLFKSQVPNNKCCWPIFIFQFLLHWKPLSQS